MCIAPRLARDLCFTHAAQAANGFDAARRSQPGVSIAVCPPKHFRYFENLLSDFLPIEA